MIRRPPRSTRTDTLFPYTTLFRSLAVRLALEQPPGDHARERLLAPALAAHHFGCLRQPEIAEIDQRQPIAAVEDAHMLVGMAAAAIDPEPIIQGQLFQHVIGLELVEFLRADAVGVRLADRVDEQIGRASCRERVCPYG